MTTLRTVARGTAVAWLAIVVAGGGVLAQQALTRTPAPAPGYTNVVVTQPVQAVQEGAWSMKASQEGAWTMKVADLPLRTITDQPAPTFIRLQKSYVFSWMNGGPAATFLVTEIRPDGWVHATTTENGRRRTVWVNTRQLALVEEAP